MGQVTAKMESRQDSAGSNFNTSYDSFRLLKELKHAVSCSAQQSCRDGKHTKNIDVIGDQKVNFQNLQTAISVAPVELLKAVGSQILDPLLFILEKNQQTALEKDLLALVDCIKIVTLSFETISFEDQKKVLMSLIKTLQVRKNVEEIATGILQAFEVCFENFPERHCFYAQFYSYQNFPMLAAILQSCVQFLGSENSSEGSGLPLTAISCFDIVIGRKFHDLELESKDIRTHCLASIFPGIAAVFMKTILNAGNLKSVVFAKTLACFGNFLTTAIEQNSPNAKSADDGKDRKIPVEIQEMLVKRDEIWLEKVNLHLEKFLNSVQPILISHSCEKVRIASVQFCEDVISKCGISLSQPCVYTLVWVLLCLEQDRYPEVNSLAFAAKERLVNKNCEIIYSIDFQLKFFDDCMKLSSEMSKCLTRVSDDDFEALLTRILACLSVLDVKQCFRLPSNLSKFLQNVLECLEVEMQAVHVIETPSDNRDACSDDRVETNSKIFDDSSINFGLRFKDLKDEHLLLLRKVLANVITQENISWVLKSIADKLQLSDKDPKLLQILCLLSLIIDSATFHFDTKVQYSVNKVFDDQITRTVEIFHDDIDKWNIAYIVLSLKLGKACVKKIGKHLSLKAILYKVAIFATHNVAIVASAALDILFTIAIVFNNNKPTISTLIEENSDYLFSDCVLKLKYSSLYPEVISVLCVIFQFANEKSLLFAKDIVFECESLLNVAAKSKGFTSSVERIFLLLAEISKFVVRHFGVDLSNRNENVDVKTVEDNHENMSECLREFVHEKLKARKLSTDDTKSTDAANQNAETEDEFDQSALDLPETDPVQIQIAHKIVQLCIYHASTTNFKTKVYCFTCAEKSFEFLASVTSGNHLLPIVHQFWKPTVARLNDEKAVVKLKAFNLIVLMSKVSKDFVRKKIAEDCTKPLLESLELLLSNYAKLAQLKFISTYDKTTHDFKLLRILLQSLPSLFINSRIFPWDRPVTFRVTKTVISYLMLFETIDQDVYGLLSRAKTELQEHDCCLVRFLEDAYRSI